ncbi:MAG: hypothetical protein JKY43_00755 [Phycisphaerales bacterium]|nr:hypothetical protein [Phycisphaerales bacterium]
MTDDTTETKPVLSGEIRADRACIGCGFNLYAQPVTKEPHYGLAIARCPECGTVAALQTYPVMTHWVNRFKALIAGVWVVVLLGLFIGNTMSLMGMAQGASNLAGQKMSDIIGEANSIWVQEQEAIQQAVNQVSNPATTTSTTIPGFPAGTTIVTSNGVTTVNGVVVSTATTTTTTTPGRYRWTRLDSQWIENHLDETIKSSGGLRKNIDKEYLVMLIPGTIVAVFFGIFWSIVLLGGSRRRALIVPLVACVLAMLIHLGISIPGSGTTYASSLTQNLYGPVIGPMYLAVLFILSAIGIWSGRKIARFVVVTALPPRSRVSLSLLWTCDGLELPRP